MFKFSKTTQIGFYSVSKMVIHSSNLLAVILLCYLRLPIETLWNDAFTISLVSPQVMTKIQ